MKNSKKLLCLILASFVLFLSACASVKITPKNDSSTPSEEQSNSDYSSPPIGTVNSQNLMLGVSAEIITASDDLSKGNNAYNQFSTKLLKQCFSKNENVLISPLSAIYALGLTANGADGETLKQMEEVFGIDMDALNNYLYSYMKKKAEEDAEKLSIANSIWFKNSFNPHAEFLQKNANYYNAAAYRADFSASQTVDDINAWISEKTKGMINDVIEDISSETVMFLINALAFEDQWETPYEDKSSVRDGEFTTESGETVTVEFMYSEGEKYIYDENAQGFIKKYKGNYAFAALLPNENISVEEYISTLTGEKISEILNRKENYSFELYTSLPKFETDFSVEMTEIFKALGMTDAFIPHVADFSKLGDGSGLHIASILQKTFISVGELGTKAGAATVVVIEEEGCPMETKTVYLNRPFVYMLIDTTTNTPFFIGTMMNPTK